MHTIWPCGQTCTQYELEDPKVHMVQDSVVGIYTVHTTGKDTHRYLHCVSTLCIQQVYTLCIQLARTWKVVSSKDLIQATQPGKAEHSHSFFFKPLPPVSSRLSGAIFIKSKGHDGVLELRDFAFPEPAISLCAIAWASREMCKSSTHLCVICNTHLCVICSILTCASSVQYSLVRHLINTHL